MTSEKDLQNLLEEYKFKIEMHCHSNPASPCADFSPEEVVHIYSEIGYDAIVLTNHLNFGLMKDGESAKDYVDRYMEDYYRASEEADRTGLTLIYGWHPSSFPFFARRNQQQPPPQGSECLP